jgi:hypothetical protein
MDQETGRTSTADGTDRHEAAEYCTITVNFKRVYIADPGLRTA